MQRCAIGLLCLVSCHMISGCSGSATTDSNSQFVSDAAPLFSESESAVFNTESYDTIRENEFFDTARHPLSTFSIDVDTASYANIRRMLNQGSWPPPGAVRIEELINYFRYDYTPPRGEHPFAVTTHIARCPWTPSHQLVRIALRGRPVQLQERPAANLVFLLDVSGSMDQPNKLPLVKSSLRLLLDNLNSDDRIAVVVYAGASGIVLPSTLASEKTAIESALEQLQAHGSTHGAAGINLAYDVANRHMIDGGINRVILCTDGDFNVGITDHSRLVQLIEEKSRSNIFLTVLGFGRGNIKDDTMEKLADHGNGNYGYIDSLLEAQRMLVEQLGGTLQTIAKDVKIQVDFNPRHVKAYRLIGYENRLLQAEDFRDDAQDAGEIGAGHTVTALYEIVPPGVNFPKREVEPSKYVETTAANAAGADREAATPAAAESAHEVLTVRVRYKQPEGHESVELRVALTGSGDAETATDSDFRFAQSVAAYGMLLRNSAHKGDVGWDWVIDNAEANLGDDAGGYRFEFVQLAKKAQLLARTQN